MDPFQIFLPCSALSLHFSNIRCLLPRLPVRLQVMQREELLPTGTAAENEDKQSNTNRLICLHFHFRVWKEKALCLFIFFCFECVPCLQAEIICWQDWCCAAVHNSTSARPKQQTKPMRSDGCPCSKEWQRPAHSRRHEFRNPLRQDRRHDTLPLVRHHVSRQLLDGPALCKLLRAFLSTGLEGQQ